MSENVKRALGIAVGFLAFAMVLLLLTGCFIANAKKRDRDREIASTNLPPMEVTTNLFNPKPVPGFR